MEARQALRRDTSPARLSPEPKRRKLRKGTQSCWECKRRKARCTFSTSNETSCEGCKSRGISCISQEHPQQPPPAGGNGQIVERLGYVEALIEHLIDVAGHRNPFRGSPNPLEEGSSDRQSSPSIVGRQKRNPILSPRRRRKRAAPLTNFKEGINTESTLSSEVITTKLFFHLKMNHDTD